MSEPLSPKTRRNEESSPKLFKEDNMNRKKYPIHATIVIRLNGDETTLAYLPDNPGQITRHTFAKRNPKDEYDAYIGARVALDRLFGKYSDSMFEEHQEDDTPKKGKAPEKTQPRWKIGDRVIATGYPIYQGRYGKEGTVTKVEPAFTPGETRYYADFGGIAQTWCSFNTDAVKKAPETTDTPEKEDVPAPKFQVGDIVRVTKASMSFGFYETGDVAVVADIITPVPRDWQTGYKIVVRSKERKGNDGIALAEELTLLHRPTKEGKKR